jgi:hypothetical protein
MTIPQHPFRSQWQPIEVDVVGYHLVDTIETTALEAIHTFCDQHPAEVAGHPISLSRRSCWASYQPIPAEVGEHPISLLEMIPSQGIISNTSVGQACTH